MVGDAVEEVGRLVWEAEGADILPVSSGGAVGVLGRWLRGGDAERAEDALLASYHLYDKDLLALAPAIARWVGVGPVSAHVRRLLGMVPVKELRPVLVPALAARLREEPDPHGPPPQRLHRPAGAPGTGGRGPPPDRPGLPRVPHPAARSSRRTRRRCARAGR